MQQAGLVLLKILVRLFSMLPFRVLYLFSNLLAILLRRVFKYRGSVIRKNLCASFPEKSPGEIDRLVMSYYRHLSDILLESIKGWSIPVAQLQERFTYRNSEIFNSIKSAIVLTTHYGNWEWGVLTFPSQVSQTVLGPYKPLKNRLVNDYLISLRAKGGSQPIPMARIGRALVTYRNQPCVWVFIADQTPSDVKNAHWVNFFHRETPFLHGVEKIARQTNFPVFMSDVQRLKRGFYEVTFIEICKNPETSREGEITNQFAKQLEAIIRRKPDDWLWSHRRWKRARGR